MKKLFCLILIFTAASALFAQQNPHKYALVIGNSNYTDFGMLNNAKNDADDIADTLKSLGFTVDKIVNGNRSQMENAAVNLRNKLSENKNSYGFFFYAGHGVQHNGINYLIPVDANIPDSDFLRERAVSLQVILDMLNRSNNALNIVVLDACRDIPSAWTRSMDRGFAVVNPPTDSIIMYATAAGKTASDGKGRNGLFTSHLLKHLKTPGIEVNDVFRRTMNDVAVASNNEQRPALYTDFAKTAYLGSQPAQQTVTSPAPAQTNTTTQSTQAVQTAKPTVQPQPIIPIVTGMVRINGGSFTMGSIRYSSEKPQHQVTVSHFYMSKYEVTQKEYQEVMGTNPSKFKGDNLPVENVSWYNAIEYCNNRSEKEGLTPVYIINKKSEDKNNKNKDDNFKWTVTLNQNANGYRLPTEAEWEYACRAGTATNIRDSINDNTGWYKANSGDKTNPVGQKLANEWGLYDMHGNVLEWCWDWYGAYKSKAQSAPTGAAFGYNRVVRGGSWSHHAADISTASRSGHNPCYSFDTLGFRVVRNAE